MILYFLYKTINKLINYISHFWNHGNYSAIPY